jgi:hypothetical protein
LERQHRHPKNTIVPLSYQSDKSELPKTLFDQSEEIVTTKAMKAHKGCLLCSLRDFFAFVVKKMFGLKLDFLELANRTNCKPNKFASFHPP